VLWPLEVDSAAEFLLWAALSDLRILKLWCHIEKATPKSLNTKFIDNLLIFLMNLVTPRSSTQNDDYGRHKTAGRHIVDGGRWKFHIHATDQHHLARGAITEIRWAPSHATEMTWLVAIIESTKKTVMRLLASTSNLTWLRVAVRNRKLGIAMRGIQPRAEYQRERRHSQVSNGSLKNLNRSTVQVPWLIARRRVW
jgi:hypothetical protein